jgi:hypothetical protein
MASSRFGKRPNVKNFISRKGLQKTFLNRCDRESFPNGVKYFNRVTGLPPFRRMGLHDRRKITPLKVLFWKVLG